MNQQQPRSSQSQHRAQIQPQTLLTLLTQCLTSPKQAQPILLSLSNNPNFLPSLMQIPLLPNTQHKITKLTVIYAKQYINRLLRQNRIVQLSKAVQYLVNYVSNNHSNSVSIGFQYKLFIVQAIIDISKQVSIHTQNTHHNSIKQQLLSIYQHNIQTKLNNTSAQLSMNKQIVQHNNNNSNNSIDYEHISLLLYTISSSLLYAYPNSIKITQHHIQFIGVMFSKCLGFCMQVNNMVHHIISNSHSNNNNNDGQLCKAFNILGMCVQSLLNFIDCMKKYYPHSTLTNILSQVQVQAVIKACLDLNLPYNTLKSTIFYRNKQLQQPQACKLLSHIKYNTIKMLNKCSCILFPAQPNTNTISNINTNTISNTNTNTINTNTINTNTINTNTINTNTINTNTISNINTNTTNTTIINMNNSSLICNAANYITNFTQSLLQIITQSNNNINSIPVYQQQIIIQLYKYIGLILETKQYFHLFHSLKKDIIYGIVLPMLKFGTQQYRQYWDNPQEFVNYVYHVLKEKKHKSQKNNKQSNKYIEIAQQMIQNQQQQQPQSQSQSQQQQQSQSIPSLASTLLQSYMTHIDGSLTQLILLCITVIHVYRCF